MISRRTTLAALLAVIAAALAPSAIAGPRAARPGRVHQPARKVRRRVRRRIRRRHRRRVVRRMLLGRPVWVVPIGLAVGWELLHDDKVVVVREVKIVEVDGGQREVLVVAHRDGTVEDVEVVREDDEANAVELEGSTLPQGDESTPGVDAEIEVEEEVEVQE